jgi:hypothetical protein
MSAQELLNELLDLGFDVSLLKDDRIAVRPPERLTANLRRAIRENKSALVTSIRSLTVWAGVRAGKTAWDFSTYNGQQAPSDPAAEAPGTLPEAPAVAVTLRREIAEIERRDFPGGFPTVLARVIGHFLASPCDPQPADLAGWWAGAHRQVWRILARVKPKPDDCATDGKPALRWGG